MHPEDLAIKRRARAARADAGSPTYAEIAERISASHPELGVSKTAVDRWLAQGSSSVAIPARLIAPLAEVLGVSVAVLLTGEDEMRERMAEIEVAHKRMAQQMDAHIAMIDAETARLTAEAEEVGEELDLEVLEEYERDTLRTSLVRVLEKLDSTPATGKTVKPSAATGKFVARAPKAGKLSAARPRVED